MATFQTEKTPPRGRRPPPPPSRVPRRGRPPRDEVRVRHRGGGRVHRAPGRAAPALVPAPDLRGRKGRGETIEGVSGREAEAVQRAWVARDVPNAATASRGR